MSSRKSPVSARLCEATSEPDVGGNSDDSLVELVKALDDVRFEFTAEAIHDIMNPPPLDPRLAAFIDSYARYCADPFTRGLVPPTENLASFVKQYFHAYRHKPCKAQPIQKNPTKRGT